MKTTFNNSRRRCGAFTLTEMMVAVAIFSLVVGGILTAHMWGLRISLFDQRKLMATDWSRRTFGQITEQVQECNSVQVGSISNGVFQGLLDGEAQQGSALLIYPTTNTTSYIVYFVNGTNQLLCSVATPSTNSTVILADSVTNCLFSAQDFSGNVLSNSLNNRVINVSLGFYQPTNYLVSEDSYQLEMSATRRALQ
jgi:prepilin-type N-terminal cleavage/methylation domain-containing protein